MRANELRPFGGDWSQPNLWHDTPEDALRAVVDALGGPKRVGVQLWPAKSMAECQRRLLHCLDRDRPEKLALAEVDLLGQLSRDAGCHVLISYFAASWGYEMPQTQDPDDEEDRLRRVFLEAVRSQERIAARLEQLESARIQREQRRTG